MVRLLERMQLKTMCVGLIGLMIAIGMIVAGATYQSLSSVDEISSAWDELQTNANPKASSLYEMRGEMGYGGAIHKLKNMVLRGNVRLGPDTRDALARVQKQIDIYRSLPVSENELTDLSIIEGMVGDYQRRLERALELVKAGVSGKEIDSEIIYDDKPALEAINRLRILTYERRFSAQAAMRNAIDTAAILIRTTAIAVILSLIFFAASLVFFFHARLMKPLSILVAHVNRIGSGDLSGRVKLPAKDEFGVLGGAVNSMTDGLETLTAHAREASQHLAAVANETLAATRQQAASVEEQFASVQQVTATVEEIVQSGEQMTSKAREVLRHARKTLDKGNEGLGSVQATSEAMGEIRSQTELVATNIVALSEQTQAVSEIIATVNDITQRSELLALNAAIEAAAAGEHGRSFSVVAEEIKAMADQSKSATSQITAILRNIHDGINTSVMLTEESVKRVESGRSRSEKALAMIGDITESLRLSIGAFELSLSATNQQKIGLDQVAIALQQIRSGGEQTSSGTRQIELAVNDITALSSDLNQSIKRYAA